MAVDSMLSLFLDLMKVNYLSRFISAALPIAIILFFFNYGDKLYNYREVFYNDEEATSLAIRDCLPVALIGGFIFGFISMVVPRKGDRKS